MIITEKQILSEIEKVLRENRKVIKLPNSAPQPEPMPAQVPMQPDMQQGAMSPMGSADPMMGGDMPADNETNEFDTNFDAGVEADEDSDPKRYIQQLTGKLSQSINSFNSEQGPDAGLCKYVASMIIAATCKNLDEKQKKELIEKINSAQDNSVEDSEGNDETDNMGSEEMPMNNMDGGDMNQQEPMPINEHIITKQEFMELVRSYDNDNDKPLEIQKQNKCPKAWRSKFN
jgi:hypothetical protein